MPEGPPARCATSDDCDRSHGEVCEEGVCWGNPPAGPFAAVVSPPSERGNELISRELLELLIPDHGWIGDVALEEPVTYGARLSALCPALTDCSNLAVGATITLTRPSLFPGGPGFRTEIEVAPGTDQFKLTVPRTRPSDTAYTVSLVPAGRNDPSQGPNSAAALLPPKRFELRVPDTTTGKVIEVGAEKLAILEGTLTMASQGLKDYRVVALGRWEERASLTEVSTVAYTSSTGRFTLRLSADVVGAVEIVAKPFGDSSGLPTLHIANVPNSGATGRALAMPPLGNRIEVAIPVTRINGSGALGPVEGARVIVTGGLGNAQSPSFTTFSTEATTGSDGVARLKLFDNAAFADTYRLSIVPPAGSESGVVFEEPFDLAKVGQPRPPLPARTALRGMVRDAGGAPLAGVGVTVRPSLRFQWSLPDGPQAFLTSIPAGTTVTPDTGEYVVWVDPLLASTFGTYDLFFEPRQAADTKIAAPALLRTDYELPRDSATVVTVPDIVLPEPAFIHGRITTPGGVPVEGAELKVFRVVGDASLCTQVSNAPASCPIPATVLGRAPSDNNGTVRFTLPR
ncbi:MAG: hypothetical protein KF773_40430 [Deltaproteobacteria bacterium]|nr:hypothetical protein [Deltaproteobacteria bacterium]MCW5806562.1 hypothetical protein [Deltaproteobacteria bacterium]